VSVNKKTKAEGPMPLDEAWWAALLAEEEKHRRSSSGNFSHGDGREERKGSQPSSQTNAVTFDWDYALRIFEDDEAVQLQVIGYNRGGLLVGGDELQGFVPVSHLLDIQCNTSEADREQLLKEYKGRTIQLKVIECDPERGRIVFSERAALAGPGQRNLLFEHIKAGDCLHGTVTNITEFGVFIDLGGIEGLIHVSELSWGRVRHPGDVVSIGDVLPVYIIQVDKERSRIALSLKRLHDNPWEKAVEHYTTGQVVDAVITSIAPFGAFARLEEGLDGLIHISEMGLDGENDRPEDAFKEGQLVKAKVLNVDPVRQRLGLSLILSK